MADTKIVPWGKYQGVPNVLIRKHARRRALLEYFFKELKEGGQVHRYLERMKATTEQRYRQLARKRQHVSPKQGSEFRLVAEIPKHDFQRWTQTDPDFFKDDANLRSLKRDNPSARVFL